MLFHQGDYSNLEYKQHFEEQIEVLESYNRGGNIWKYPGSYGALDRATGT